jgi:hypothetical protein
VKQKKRADLEKKGWKVGSVKEFLGLSAKEAALVETRLKVPRGVYPGRSQGSG